MILIPHNEWIAKRYATAAARLQHADFHIQANVSRLMRADTDIAAYFRERGSLDGALPPLIGRVQGLLEYLLAGGADRLDGLKRPQLIRELHEYATHKP